jgi:hypothetical protein
MPSTPWDAEGWFIGTVQGEPVNCLFQFRTSDTGLTEVWVRRDGDATRQSTISRSPDLAQMAEHVIQEFHFARRTSACRSADDPAAPTSAECQVVSLHDYLHRDRADEDTAPPPLAMGQTQVQSR